MRIPLLIPLLLLTAVAASGGNVRVYIAPQTTLIPHRAKSGSIYWINETERSATIPAFERYSFIFSPLTRSASVGLEARAIDHPTPDRRIAGWAIVHDQTTVDIDAKPNELVAISAEFRGDKSRFKSNTIVLRKSPKA